jgi:hypothetical protein
MSVCRMLDTRTISWTVTSIILTVATVMIMVGSSEQEREVLTRYGPAVAFGYCRSFRASSPSGNGQFR